MTKLSGDKVRELDAKYNLHPWMKQKNMNALPVERAEGIYYWDYDGNKYYDMSSQLVNVNLGYGNKEIINAIKEQVERLPYIAPAYAEESKSRLAEELIKISPKNMRKVFFTCGGSDANESAINMARTVTGRTKIFSRYRSYHGSTLGSGNLSGDPRRFALENPAATGFIKFFDPYVYREYFNFSSDEEASNYYIAKLREQLTYEGPENVAAIIVESITGANGVIIPPDGYLQGIRKICDEFGIIMICDEVMAGFGRTGKMFAFENWGIEPDIIVFAKGVTCGYVQLGGVIVNERVAKHYEDTVFQYGLTYSGHPLGCAAGLASVKYYEDANILENVNKVGKVLGERLEEFKSKYKSVGDVRYIGLFSAVELVKNKGTKEPLVPYGRDPEGIIGKIISLLKSKGFSTFGRENTIIIAPPLIITEEELLEALKIFEEVLEVVDREYI
ncbi:aminotransferase class III-fold pyridoxal phosphate-dependent enzyme [Clostridium cylindrosporum]|uniref:Taurine--pyruvate aminotransferase Tpa n=1 Tax=Clostridium cylindrosporum DSM 605 TaxID=1121307 RepID=A0A0J8DC07_CLOCY|nr:aminotransferase class III-fold pyridoxal phosphate-dependent enzyme [Clostridium cylindrosporum]KMT21813.1 taurine--pyruvate aminotransferase Tpa [Clostridium cylindrosporum DSM 605]